MASFPVWVQNDPHTDEGDPTSQEAASAQRELWLLNRDVEPEDPNEIGSSYLMFGTFQNPKFNPYAGNPPQRDASARRELAPRD